METYFTRAIIKITENVSWVHLLLVKDRINVNGKRESGSAKKGISLV